MMLDRIPEETDNAEMDPELFVPSSKESRIGMYEGISREKLIEIIIELREENDLLRAITSGKHYPGLSSEDKSINNLKSPVELESTPADRNETQNSESSKGIKFLDLGSMGSSSMMLFTAADNSVSRDSPKPDVPEESTDTESVLRSYMALERGAGAFNTPNVADYRNLFKKTVAVEFEADSPVFRKKIDTLEEVVVGLRAHLQLMVAKCRSYCMSGTAHGEAGKDFSNLMQALRDGKWCMHVGELGNLLAAFGAALDEVQWYRDAVMTSLENTFSAPMEEFVKIEVKTVKKLKQGLQKCSEEYEQALSKFLMLKASVDVEVVKQKEAELATLRKRFELSRYDLVTELNSLETKKKFQLTERIVSALYAYLGYFHTCHTLIATIEPAMRQLMSELNSARKNFAREVMLKNAKRAQLQRDLDRSSADSANRLSKRFSSMATASSSTVDQRGTGSRHTFSKGLQVRGFIPSALLRSQSAITEGGLDFSMEGGGDHTAMKTEGSVPAKAGYLWKKSTNLKRDWKRRWFYIENGKLFYLRGSDSHPSYSTSSSSSSTPSTSNITSTTSSSSHSSNIQHVCDLVISTVKENVEDDMRFTFEVISPGQRIYVLQGEGEEDTKEWVKVIRQQIEHLLAQVGEEEDTEDEEGVLSRSTTLLTTPSPLVLQSLKQLNPVCADCGGDSPEWASLNLCIMICIECSGTHRGMGTHISKVRSLTLDKWSTNNLQLIERIGNTRANSLWEAKLSSGGSIITTTVTDGSRGNVNINIKKPTTCSNREDREAYIVAKYVTRNFTIPVPLMEANNMLYRAATIGDLHDVVSAVVAGGDVNYRNETDGNRCPLHVACIGGHVLVVEYLCQNNALVDNVDVDGRTPLDYTSQECESILDILVQKLERDLLL